jgi:alpha-beta hydrolase superfamily lysophospholipase
MRHTGQGSTRTLTNEKYGHEVVRSWVPAGDPVARIIAVHGIAEYSGRYEVFGELLAAAGFEVHCPDLFGFGESGGTRRAYVEEWSDYFDQVQAHVEQAAGGAPETPVVLFGHSMGGLIALGYLLSERPQPDLAVLSAPALGGGAAWQRLLAGPLAAIAPTLAVSNKLDGSLLSRDPEVAELYFADPLVITSTSTRLGNYMFKAQAAARESLDRLRVPALVLQGGADRIVSPASTAILGDLPSVERRIYPKLRHEIFNEPEGPDLVGEVVEWLRGHVT